MLGLDDDLIPLAKAARLLPADAQGRRVNPQTVWRWHRVGVSGVTLEAIKIGRRVFTSKAALDRFIRATSGAPAASDPTEGRTEERAPRHRDASSADELIANRYGLKGRAGGQGERG